MKGFFLLSGPVFSGGLFILFSLFFWLPRWVVLFDRLEGCRDHFRLGSIPPFGCLPVSLVEAPDDHHAPAALEKINFNLS